MSLCRIGPLDVDGGSAALPEKGDERHLTGAIRGAKPVVQPPPSRVRSAVRGGGADDDGGGLGQQGPAGTGPGRVACVRSAEDDPVLSKRRVPGGREHGRQGRLSASGHAADHHRAVSDQVRGCVQGETAELPEEERDCIRGQPVLPALGAELEDGVRSPVPDRHRGGIDHEAARIGMPGQDPVAKPGRRVVRGPVSVDDKANELGGRLERPISIGSHDDPAQLSRSLAGPGQRHIRVDLVSVEAAHKKRGGRRSPRLTSGAMPEKVTAATRVARSEGLVTEPMEGGIVMLDPESDRYLRLNATGRLIWEALAEPATVAELAQVLSERSGISRERAEADAATFIDGLIDFGAARPA